MIRLQRTERPQSLRLPRATTIASMVGFVVMMALLLIHFDGPTAFVAASPVAAAPVATYDGVPVKEQDSQLSFLSARINGLFLLLKARPSMCIGMGVRIALAISLEIALDGFLKTVVTPAIAATVVGIFATPLTFFIGQAIQPIIHSVSFIGFDDRLVVASLEATGIKNRLLSMYGREWHRITLLEGMATRYCMKALAGWCVGLAGLCTIIPVAGPILTALLSGWVVAWDFVYIPLSGMGHVGVFNQGKTVLLNFWQYQWFGFWAVLLEEIPLMGPACHVYNVYSAAFFLEKLYLNHTSAAMMNATIAIASQHKEL